MRVGTIATWVFLVCTTAVRAATPITLALDRKIVQNLDRAQVVVAVMLPPDYKAGSIELTPPSGFTLSATSISIVGEPNTVVRQTVTMKAADSEVVSSNYVVTASFFQGDVGGPLKRVGSTSTYAFEYRNVRIGLGAYFAVGLAGVLLGYVVRLLVKVLASITPVPSPDPPQPTGDEGPITRFVRGHYYVVDCGVTLILALLVMAALIKNGRPPEAASQWYAALVAGAALGLLTNSELITKIPVPRTT